MKRISTILVLVTIFTNSFSQTFPTTNDGWAESSPITDYAREVINKLCDPNMNGRGVAKGGEQLAADYILTEMRSIGIMPMGETYFQDFTVDANFFPGRMSLTLGKEKSSLQPGFDFWVSPSCPPIEGEFNAVYISREQMKDRLVLMDKLRDAEGGFIIVDNTKKEGETEALTKKLNTYIDKMKTDMKVKIQGVIIYDKMNLRWSSSTNQSPRPVIFISSEVELSDKINSIKIEIDAEYKVGFETQNVIGIVEGSGVKDSAIVITAHYDHLGMMGNELIFPGANSNAAGVAMLLSLAKHFYMIRPKYSIIFVALGGEELGFAGSKAFVNSSPIPISNIKFLLNFDVIGTGKNGTKVVNGSKYEGNFKTLSNINKRYEYVSDLTARGEVCFSGHCEFSKNEVPNYWLYTIGGNYHNIQDTPDNATLTSFEGMYNLMIKYIEIIK